MIEQLCREILHPDKEFSPVPFWFFNDMPDEDKIRKQLTDYVDKGVNTIVLHPRIGVPVEIGYLSKEYIKAVRFIVKTADELVGDVVIYHKAEELLAENVYRDIQICDECRALRVTGLDKYNTLMYLFVNEGVDSINTKVSIPTINEDTSLIEIDLCSGDITRVNLINHK